MFPDLDSIVFETLPFEHFTGRCDPSGACMEWLDWLEREAPWKLTTAEFYEQYEFSLLHAPLPVRAGYLVRPGDPVDIEAPDVGAFPASAG